MSSDIKLSKDSVLIENQTTPTPGVWVIPSNKIAMDWNIDMESTAGGNLSRIHLSAGTLGSNIDLKSREVSIISSQDQVLALKSEAGFGSCRIEWISDAGKGNEWRPAFVESVDVGNFTGGLRFCVNGAGASNKKATVEVMHISNKSVSVKGSLTVNQIDLVEEIKKLRKEVDELKAKIATL